MEVNIEILLSCWLSGVHTCIVLGSSFRKAYHAGSGGYKLGSCTSSGDIGTVRDGLFFFLWAS